MSFTTSSDEYSKIYFNAFVDNNLDEYVVSSQAHDDGTDNTWYDKIHLIGNYWNDYITGLYAIDDNAYAEDPYPLQTSPL